MRCRDLCWLALALVSGTAFAATEVIGPVYPVAEPDMVVWMKERAGSYFTPERLAALEAEKREATHRYAHTPPGTDLPRTTKPVTRWFDPSITVPYDLRDQDGRLIHAAGTTVNPLEWRSLTQRLLFLDGNDEDQVRWAEVQIADGQWQVKPILVAGPPLELGRQWQRHVFFDQQGLLVGKLGIKQLPAIVRQEGMRLQIDEVVP
ncbi:MAG: type-F conjugative transfer system protein TraW [Candidatus Thiodiazotropha sp.]